MKKTFIILLTFAVTFSIGVCPCGLASSFAAPMQAILRLAERPKASGPCPLCATGTRHETEKNKTPFDPAKCYTTVTGDTPSQQLSLPAIVAMPVILQPLLDFNGLHLKFFQPSEVLRSELHPPPTLLNLSCSLTT